jgi:hypothetical protein
LALSRPRAIIILTEAVLYNQSPTQLTPELFRHPFSHLVKLTFGDSKDTIITTLHDVFPEDPMWAICISHDGTKQTLRDIHLEKLVVSIIDINTINGGDYLIYRYIRNYLI